MPLGFDMPLEQLMEYKGTNPRPADFDPYWDTALAEMKAIDPQVEIVPNDEVQVPYATCSQLYFTGVGGARVHAKLIQPKDAQKAGPAVVMFHGYTANSGDWIEKLAYAAAGITVAAIDVRGQGGLSEDLGSIRGTTHTGQIIRGLDDAPEKLFFRSVFLDAAQLAGILMDMDTVDENRVGVFGFSQGGALSLACAALEPRVKRAAVMFPFLSDYLRVWQMNQAKDAYGELREYFRRHDPQHKREHEVFERLGYIDIQHLMPRVKAEVVMAMGLEDTVCPPSTQFAAYNKITSKKSLEFYPDYGHESLPGFLDQALMFMLKL